MGFWCAAPLCVLVVVALVIIFVACIWFFVDWEVLGGGEGSHVQGSMYGIGIIFVTCIRLLFYLLGGMVGFMIYFVG